ncbi:hypothetical protein R6Q57_006490 [Mikania cordata]
MADYNSLFSTVAGYHFKSSRLPFKELHACESDINDSSGRASEHWRSDCGAVGFTREGVEALLNERIKDKNKLTFKEKCDVMFDYIKRLIMCIKWFQEIERDILLQQEKQGKMLESAEKKCNDLGMTAAMESLIKEKDARLSAERSRVINRVKTCEQRIGIVSYHNPDEEDIKLKKVYIVPSVLHWELFGSQILSLNDTYKRLQEYNTSLQQYNNKLQSEVNQTNKILKNVEKEKVTGAIVLLCKIS